MNTNENSDWEKEASFLAGLSRENPYKLPEGYFDDLDANIHQSIFLAKLAEQEKNIFEVPANYFEDLSANINARIKLETIQSSTADSGFKVPVNYFETLQNQVLSKTSATAKKPKLVSLWKNDFVKYAAAACFMLLTASSFYFNEQMKLRNIELANEQILYDIDESVIIEHLQEIQTANTSAVAGSNQEVENYILENYSTNDLANHF